MNKRLTDYWLSLLVEFEDGDCDVRSMHIRKASSTDRLTDPVLDHEDSLQVQLGASYNSVFFNGDKMSVRSLLEEELNEKLSFLGGLAAAFRDQVHTDIEVKPGHNGPSLFAHRALLAARSEIFKNMLDTDGCKVAPRNAITLPELNHEELDSLLEFLYSGAMTAGQAYEAMNNAGHLDSDMIVIQRQQCTLPTLHQPNQQMSLLQRRPKQHANANTLFWNFSTKSQPC